MNPDAYYRNLPVSKTIPGGDDEMFLNEPIARNGGSIARFVNAPVFFPPRSGRPMRRVVCIQSILPDTLSAFPGGVVQPNINAYQALTLTLRAPNGDYLVRNLPLVTILMNGGDARRNRPKWWDYLPVDWDTSYVTSHIQQQCWALFRVQYAEP